MQGTFGERGSGGGGGGVKFVLTWLRSGLMCTVPSLNMCITEAICIKYIYFLITYMYKILYSTQTIF